MPGYANDKYKLVGRLGKGSYGFVDKAKKISDGLIYACKIVKLDNKKFGRKSLEHKIHISLSHANIVKMHEVFVPKRCDMDDLGHR